MTRPRAVKATPSRASFEAVRDHALAAAEEVRAARKCTPLDQAELRAAMARLEASWSAVATNAQSCINQIDAGPQAVH